MEICYSFAAPMRREYVDYCRFSSTIEESFTQKGLQHSPLLVPVPHLASPDSWGNFLNFQERTLLSKAMEKLGKSPDVLSNITEVFVVSIKLIYYLLFVMLCSLYLMHNIKTSRGYFCNFQERTMISQNNTKNKLTTCCRTSRMG